MENLDSPPQYFTLPDLVSQCPWPLVVHANGRAIAADSDKWLVEGCTELPAEAHSAIYRFKTGLLSAHCYPRCDDEHLRVVADFISMSFHLDDISDGMESTEQLANVVLNALWFPDRYLTCVGKEHPDVEPSVSRLIRE